MYKYLRGKEKVAVFPSWAELKSILNDKENEVIENKYCWLCTFGFLWTCVNILIKYFYLLESLSLMHWITMKKLHVINFIFGLLFVNKIKIVFVFISKRKEENPACSLFPEAMAQSHSHKLGLHDLEINRTVHGDKR